MARRISMATRVELLKAVGARCRDAVRAERCFIILDEFAAVTGCHRKHAIRLLAGGGRRRMRRYARRRWSKDLVTAQSRKAIVAGEGLDLPAGNKFDDVASSHIVT